MARFRRMICTMRKRDKDDDDRTHPLFEKGDTVRKRKRDSPPLLECSHQSSDCSPEFSNKFVTICGGWEWSDHLNAAVKLRWWRWEEERRRRRRSWRCFFFLALLWLTILLYSHDHLNDQEGDDCDPDFSLVFNAVVQMVMLQEHRRFFLFLALCFDNHHRCNQIYHQSNLILKWRCWRWCWRMQNLRQCTECTLQHHRHCLCHRCPRCSDFDASLPVHCSILVLSICVNLCWNPQKKIFLT